MKSGNNYYSEKHYMVDIRSKIEKIIKMVHKRKTLEKSRVFNVLGINPF